MTDDHGHDAGWKKLLDDGDSLLEASRFVYNILPSEPRCSMCKRPFSGVGGSVMRRVFHIAPSTYNPAVCNSCDRYFQMHPGGAETEATLLFADVRGSTTLAEGMSAVQFSSLMTRFYDVATQMIVRTHGVIEKFVGDEVVALYARGISGDDHTRHAIDAARQILVATGHEDPGGPWLPVGAGVHRGSTYVGAIGAVGSARLTVLGDSANTTARLASSARQGEVLVSEPAYHAPGVHLGELEHRKLELKGKSEPFGVYVLKVAPPA